MNAPTHVGEWPNLFQGSGPELAAAVQQWRRLLRFNPSTCCKPRTRFAALSGESKSIYLIESGVVKLTRVDDVGRETAFLLRYPGDLIGTTECMLQLPRCGFATSLTNCRLGVVPRAAALSAFRTHVEAASVLAEYQALDSMRLQSLLMEARFLSAEQRFFRLLFRLALGTGAVRSSCSEITIPVPLTDADIADLIAMNRSAFSRLKRSLIRRGVLQQTANVFSFSTRRARSGSHA